MSTIIQMKIISGRRRAVMIKEVKVRKEIKIMCRHIYDKEAERAKNNRYNISPFDEWFKSKLEYTNPFGGLPDISPIIKEREKQRFEELRIACSLEPTPKEVSIEDQILHAVQDGWSMKGDIVWGDGVWIQTLVKYTDKEPIKMDFLDDIVPHV